MQQEILPGYLNLKGSFDDQVRNIMQNVRLTRQEVDHLNLLYLHVEGALQSSWPGCKVVPFGSIVTGLGIKTSDVDCFIDIPGDNKGNDKANVIKARKLLSRQPWLFQELFAITTAKVPIVKLFHIPTQRHCDINFKSPTGVRNSLLIAYLLHLDRRAANLAVLVKYWSKVHNLTGTNLMPNYGLTMLVIFYLQHVNILPSVLELQKDPEKQVVDGWNTAFVEDFSYNTDKADFSYNQSLYEILGGFFKFYSTLNFEENVVSPFKGTLIQRNRFKTLEDVPSEFELYKNNVSNKVCQPLRIDTKMCVQDPFEHNRNCTMSVFPRLAATLISHFKLAAQLYDENSKDFYIIDLLARKPPLAPMQQKKKGNLSKFNQSKLPRKTVTERGQNGKVTKLHRRPHRSFHNNLETLYRDSFKQTLNKQRHNV